jgi:hypothetical protein
MQYKNIIWLFLLTSLLHKGLNLVPSSFLRAFGFKREEAVGGWKKEYNEKETSLLGCNAVRTFISQKKELFITTAVRTSNPT